MPDRHSAAKTASPIIPRRFLAVDRYRVCDCRSRPSYEILFSGHNALRAAYRRAPIFRFHPTV